jgi:hypothetical protein
MATLNVGRQEVIAATYQLGYADFADDTGTVEQLIQVPEGAILVGGFASVEEVFDSTTSDALDFGDAVDPNRYVAALDLQSAGGTALLITGYKYTAQDTLDVGWTAGATGTATQGIVRITVLYVVDGRTAFSEG